MENKKTLFWALVAVLTVFILLGILTFVLLPTFIGIQISKRIHLHSDSPLYEAWLDPPVPIFLQFYLFSLLNADGIKQGEKPVVKQLGPYTYEEKREKLNVFADPAKGEIYYTEQKLYQFRADLSNGTESDVLVQFNIAYITVANMLKNQSAIVDFIVETLESALREKVFVKLTVAELIWGYEDRLLAALANFGIRPFGNATKLGLFVGQNGSRAGEYVIDDGARSLAHLGKIMAFQNHSQLTWWASGPANQINGTDGTLFSPGLRLADRIYIFSPDICRSIHLEATETVRFLGLQTLRFLPPTSLFESPLLNPDNKGFCPTYPNCLKSGVLNLGPCLQGAPVIVSQPHFYQADPEYVNGTIGMRPRPEFTTELFIEPTLGIVLKASKKLQLNLHVMNNQKFSGLSKIRTTIMPMAFINESATISDDMIQQLKSSFFLPIAVVRYTSILLIVVGSSALSSLLVFSLFAQIRNRSQNYQPV